VIPVLCTRQVRTSFEVWIADVHKSPCFLPDSSHVVASMPYHRASVVSHYQNGGFHFQVSFLVCCDWARLGVGFSRPAPAFKSPSATSLVSMLPLLHVWPHSGTQSSERVLCLLMQRAIAT
jgi:hypothetical protein